MVIFSHLRENDGQKVVTATRTFEKLEEKMFRHRNHVVFNLCCRDTDIIPPSLRLKTLIKTENARNIIAKARKDLLKERIRVSNNKLRSLKSELDLRKEGLLSLFPSNDDVTKQAFLDRLEKSREFAYKQTKWRHV